MNYNQDLKDYKLDFLEEKGWLVKESPHYKFYYFPDTLAEQDISKIQNSQEKAFEKIVDFLEVNIPNQKIKYYLYPDLEIKERLMGNRWYGQSIYSELRIHILYTEQVKPVGEHEDTHLLSLPWGISIGFFQEGLAEFMSGHAWDGQNHRVYVRGGYQRDIFPAISEYMDHKTWMDINDEKAIFFYSLAGAFVSFIIKEYGKDKFKVFYKQSNRKNSKGQNKEYFISIYGKEISDVEREFKQDLDV